MNVVFSMLDSSKQGKLAPEELIRRFDASQHSDCTSFRRTIDQIRNEFLDTFDVGATVDRFVTRTDFIDYYSIVSVTITDDSQFDLMMRQVWHVPMCTTIAHAYYNKPTQINWTSDDNNNDNSITGVHRHQFRSVE